MISDDRRNLDTSLAMQIGALSVKVDMVTASLASVDAKVDSLDAKMSRFEGVLSVVRYLGIGGVSIAVIALFRAFGFHV